MEWLLAMPTMLVGIDVSHPDHSSVEHTPSIASVVANVDDEFVEYPSSTSILKSNNEVSYSNSPDVALANATVS